MRVRLPFDRSRPGVWVSGTIHGLMLAAGLVAFAADKLPDAEEGIPVEVLTDNQVSEITRGETNAARVEPVAKPRVDRQAEVRVEREPGEAKQDVPAPPKRPADMKVADSEVAPPPEAATPPKRPELAKVEDSPPPPPRPDLARVEAAKAEAARAEKAEAEAAAKAEAEAKAEHDRKVREAEAREKAEAEAKAKAERKRIAEAKARAEAKAKADAEARARRQAEAADRFDIGDISRLLASREPSQSSGTTGREVQRTASLGNNTGTAPRLNPSQRDQIAGLIREQLIRCWQPPIAVQGAAKPPTAVIRLGLKQDGSLATEPALMNSSSDPLFRPVADSALRATRRCAPLRIPASFAPFYADWKDLVVDFDPREMS